MVTLFPKHKYGIFPKGPLTPQSLVRSSRVSNLSEIFGCQGVQRRMVVVDNIFSNLWNYFFLPTCCDRWLSARCVDYISPSLAATSTWSCFLKYEWCPWNWSTWSLTFPGAGSSSHRPCIAFTSCTRSHIPATQQKIICKIFHKNHPPGCCNAHASVQSSRLFSINFAVLCPSIGT